MERILLNGCPDELTFDEPLDNKLEMIKRGHSKSFNDNIDLVLKTMNKEDRYSHLVPLDKTICRFSPYCCNTTQTIVIKEGKNEASVLGWINNKEAYRYCYEPDHPIS